METQSFEAFQSKRHPLAEEGKEGQTSNMPPGVVRLSCLSSLTVGGMSAAVKGVNCTCFLLSSLCSVFRLSSCVQERALARGQAEDNRILRDFSSPQMSLTCCAVSVLPSSSWENIFSKSSEVVSPQELKCCRRLVQLCRDCLLVVYKFVSESRSLTGLIPEWDDTR